MFDNIDKQATAEQISEEVRLLKEFDLDKELKQEFEITSLIDLTKYLD